MEYASLHRHRGIESFGQTGDNTRTHQRHADALSEAVEQVTLYLQDERKVVPVFKNRVGVDVKTRHGLGLAFFTGQALPLFTPTAHALGVRLALGYPFVVLGNFVRMRAGPLLRGG